MRLQESGIIQNLSTTWWEFKDVDENGNEIDCGKIDDDNSDSTELDMDNVGGVFLVLVVGILISICIGVLEFIWSVRRTSIDERVMTFFLLILLFSFILIFFFV